MPIDILCDPIRWNPRIPVVLVFLAGPWTKGVCTGSIVESIQNSFLGFVREAFNIGPSRVESRGETVPEPRRLKIPHVNVSKL